MKKIMFIVSLMLAFTVFLTPAFAGIFAYDDGQRLTVAWPNEDGYYWKVYTQNMSDGLDVVDQGITFEKEKIISGLEYHKIYQITVDAYDSEFTFIQTVGIKYITFALSSESGVCVCPECPTCPECPDCICPDLIIPQKVFFGMVGPGCWTAITISNATLSTQTIILYVNNVEHFMNVPSQSSDAVLLSSIVNDPGLYAISYDAPEGVGISVFVNDGKSSTVQN